MFSNIQSLCRELSAEFHLISEQRKTLLQQLAEYISTKISADGGVHLMYVCTHNSRRSHFGQIWSKVAADFFGIENVATYSAGTEVTSFNTIAIQSLIRLGFIVTSETIESNPIYRVNYGENFVCSCFSKKVDHTVNPTSNFTAIMTCSEADIHCPFVPGAEKRFSTTYEDPKAYDGTPQEMEMYLERSMQIGRECLYVFFHVKSMQIK